MTHTPEHRSEKKPLVLVAVSAGTSETSSTTRLVHDLIAATRQAAEDRGLSITSTVIELKPLAGDIAAAMTTGFRSEALRAAYTTLGAGDAAIIATPIYKASYSGLLKSFLDVADDDMLTATPVAIAATAGTPRHALVPDTAIRPLLAYMRAIVIPTPVFAATEDWASPAALKRHSERAATELVELAASGTTTHIVDSEGDKYSRTFNGSSATTARDTENIDFSTELMRLATGGDAPPGL